MCVRDVAAARDGGLSRGFADTKVIATESQPIVATEIKTPGAVVLVITGLVRLRLETDILATLPGDVPEVRALKLLRDGFAGGSDLVIALEAEDDLSAEEAMTALAERLQKSTDLVKEVRWAQPMEQQAHTGAALLAWSMQNAAPDKLKAVRARLEGSGAERS